MTCADFVRLMDTDPAAATRAERRAVATHFQECPECREKFMDAFEPEEATVTRSGRLVPGAELLSDPEYQRGLAIGLDDIVVDDPEARPGGSR